MGLPTNYPPIPGGGKGGGSSGGSSKGGGSKGPSHPGSPGGADYYGTYLSIIQGLGIGIDKAVQAFAHHANAQHWSTGEFMYFLRQTDFYHKAFPGIMGPNNQLRMSESQYLSDYRSLSDRANQIGVNFSLQQFGFAISKGLKAGTIMARLTAIQRVNESPVVFRQFEQELKARGLAKGVVKKPDMYDFVMGLGAKNWYGLWQEASLRAGAAEAGLRIGSDITRQELHRIGASLPGFQGEMDLARNFADLKKNIVSFAPLSKLAGLGMTANDLEVLEFGGTTRGGESQADVANRAARILATLQAQRQAPATPDIAATAQGPELLGVRGLSARPQETL